MRSCSLTVGEIEIFDLKAILSHYLFSDRFIGQARQAATLGEAYLEPFI